MDERLQYLFEVIRKRLSGQRIRCPNCGALHSELIQRKYFVTELRKCGKCTLMFRFPLDTVEENRSFYEGAYAQGFTTNVPSESQLSALKARLFRGHEKDYAPYINVLKALGIPSGSTIIDFGCSWGYGSWQLTQGGYTVQGYEISRSRAKFGRERLGVNIVDSLEEIAPGADVFFSSHVLEHVPSIQEVLELARAVVRPEGLFVAFTPNGSEAFRRLDPNSFKAHWSKVHPNLLSDEYYRKAFADNPLLLASSPYDQVAIRRWSRVAHTELSMSGKELLAVAVL